MQHVPANSQSNIPKLQGSQNSDFIENNNTVCIPNRNDINIQRAIWLYKQLVPLTLPNMDSHENIIQLWKIEKYGLIGSVMDRSGHIKVIRSSKIINPLSSDAQKDNLIERLETCGLRRWSIVFNPLQKELIIWPVLVAAGKDGGPRNRDTKNGDIGQVNTYLRELDTKTFSAAIREKNKEDVKYNSKGVPYNHQKKVENLTKGLTKHTALVKDRLNKPHLPEHEQQQLKSELSKSENLLKYANVAMQLNYKHYRYGVNKLNHPDQKALLKPRGRGLGEGRILGGKLPPMPGLTKFQQLIQKLGLTTSYNKDHPEHPISPKGAMGGEIGGVGGRTELIQGLFDTPDALFENTHLFFLPTFGDGQLPMTDDELRQILRELAIGIYVHDTVPFFSLHFNQNSDLYPVIHPAYQNTLVGQVISLLDYFMKGYLNGGIFKEEFIKKWAEDPNWERKKESVLQEIIDFKTYCQKNLTGADKKYTSLRAILDISTNPELLARVEEAVGQKIGSISGVEPPIFSDNTLFSNSFRIIAKQRSIQKADNLFVLDADFDVFYTIEPAPAYKNALAEYQKIHDQPPASYQLMVEAYEKKREAIHDHMVKLPICSKYFAMLGVINFFCSYMMTLKNRRKVPIFPLLQPTQNYGSPVLFPHLPLEHFKEEKLKVNFAAITKEICSSHRAELMQYLLQPSDQTASILIQALTPIFRNSILASCSAVMHRHLKNHPDIIQNDIVKESKGLLDNLRKGFLQSKKEIRESKQVSMQTSEEMQEGFDVENEIRKMSPSQFNNIIKTVSSETADHLIKIRQMSSSEYEELKAIAIKTNSQLPLLQNLEEQDLPGYIIDNIFPTLFEDQLVDRQQSLSVNALHLLSEVSSTTIEKGKRIVGGCGMTLTPMKVIPSRKGERILQEHWSAVQQVDLEKWTKIGDGKSNETQGAIFKLMFEDLPPGMDEDYSWMENVFIGSSQEAAQRSLDMQEIGNAIREEDEKGFIELIKDQELNLMRNNNGATLIHLAAMRKNPFYITTLLNKGLSANIQDKEKYLPIHYAAMYGNEEVAALLLNANPHFINAESDNKSTPLIVAIQNGQEVMARFLLARKAVCNTVTSEGYTPLHCALHHGHENLALALLEQPEVDVNKSTEEGVTPLMLACELDSEKLVKELLKKKADPKAARKDGIIALDIAVKRNCLPVCEILFPHSTLSDYTIEITVKESSLDILKLFAARPSFLAYRNYAKDTPLVLAVRFANMPAALHILSLTQNPADLGVENVFKESAISLSMDCGFVDLIEAMIQKGAIIRPMQLLKSLCRFDISPFLTDYLSKQKLSRADLQELLLEAAEAGQHIIISMLLVPMQVNLDALNSPKGWKIEHYLAKSDGIYLLRQRILKTRDPLNRIAAEGGKTLAYLAAENGSWSCLKFLLAQMLKNNISLDNHYQTRHLAYAIIERGDLNGVHLLHDSIKDPSLFKCDLDGKGTTAAHLAAKIGSREILQFLHNQGALCDQEDTDGKTPLYYAVQCYSTRAVKFLLSKGCKITPEALYLAFSKADISNLLLEAGANVNIKSPHTQDTPLLLAVKHHDYDAFNRLIQASANPDCTNAEGWTPTLLTSDTGQHGMLEIILRQGCVDRRTYKGDTALHLASKKGHAECIKLLVLAGFSTSQPNADGKHPTILAQHSIGALAALSIENKVYAKKIGQFTQALSEGSAEAIQKMLNVLPINEIITIPWLNVKVSGTLLHLFLRLMRRSIPIRAIVVTLLQNRQLDLQLRDSEGCSYAHLLVRANIQPKNLTLNVVEYDGKTPLHYAAKFCDEIFLEELFKTSDAKNVINTPDKEGMTPLFHAILAKKIENIKFLLAQGANPNHCALNLNTPLLIACQEGFFPAIRQLLRAGADINKRGTVEQVTPLFISLEHESDEISLYLMMKGADCSTKTRGGSSIAHSAARTGKSSVLRFLSSKGISLCEPNAQGIYPIHLAAQQGKNKVLELLSSEAISLETMTILPQNRIKPPKKALTMKDAKPIHFASMAGKVETVQWLLNRHANPESKFNNYDSVLSGVAQPNGVFLMDIFKQYQLSQDPSHIYPAIITAILSDRVDSLAMLYQLGIPINDDIVDGQTGLHLACKIGSMRATHFLLNQGADFDIPNRKGQKAIEIAAANHSVDQFWQMLVRMEPNIDEINDRGETLLNIAVKAGNLAHSMILISQGASLEIADQAGETPLHAAAKKGRLDIVGLLIGCGADYTKKTFFAEKTARELSVKPDIIELIDKYSGIKTTAHEKESLLHCAIKAKIIEAVKVLCLGADVNQSIAGGKTALHIAVEVGSIPIIRILLSHGADIEAQDDLGQTPLWNACLVLRSVLLTRILIRAGADMGHKNKSGQSILQALKRGDFQGKEQMVDLLVTV